MRRHAGDFPTSLPTISLNKHAGASSKSQASRKRCGHPRNAYLVHKCRNAVWVHAHLGGNASPHPLLPQVLKSRIQAMPTPREDDMTNQLAVES